MKKIHLLFCLVFFAVTMSFAQTTKTTVVYFASGQYVLDKASRVILDEFVEEMKGKSAVQMQITGHTDPKGNAAQNEKLSKKRAETVLEYITSHGIEKGIVQIVPALAVARPESKEPKEMQQLGRRVEIKVIFPERHR
jgi:outer membrane protein OmpA-like peptidoglycan-associated protein